MTSELRPRDHKDKDVRAALELIISQAPGVWTIVKAGHWGSLRCNEGCCTISIAGTPRNARNHARDLVRQAHQHPRTDDDPRNRRRSVR